MRKVERSHRFAKDYAQRGYLANQEVEYSSIIDNITFSDDETLVAKDVGAATLVLAVSGDTKFEKNEKGEMLIVLEAQKRGVNIIIQRMLIDKETKELKFGSYEVLYATPEARERLLSHQKLGGSDTTPSKLTREDYNEGQRRWQKFKEIFKRKKKE